MSSASPSRVLVTYTYARDRHLPSLGEIILLRLSQNLFGPGSIIGSGHNLPSRSNQYNYHPAVVMDIAVHVYENIVGFAVCPMPAYSLTDPGSGLSSTDWLLSQADDFQQRHIPVPYEASTLTQPRFPTPAQFGEPLYIGGWEDRIPRWVQAVPQVAEGYTTTFQCFQPPVKLSTDELQRLRKYSEQFYSPDFSSWGTMPPFSPRGSGTLSPAVSKNAMGSSLRHVQSGASDHHGGAGPKASGSLALQALYANHAVKRALVIFDERHHTYSDDDDGDDEDEDDDDDGR